MKAISLVRTYFRGLFAYNTDKKNSQVENSYPILLCVRYLDLDLQPPTLEVR